MALAAWRTWPLMSEQSIALVNLGRLDYAAALALQQQVSALRQQESISDVLLLVEHPPVLTLGRNAHRQHVVAGDELLARRGISLFETNRGGDVTYHGPGQLVGYPILDLARLELHLALPLRRVTPSTRGTGGAKVTAGAPVG